MKRRLITSALPYVNNVPHLGNLIQVLSADVFARACRLRGFTTLYVCGTDEYGTATETKATEEGVSPAELCSRFYEIHRAIYEWFGISFDKFGRTSTPRQTEIVQGLFKDNDAAGFVKQETIEQLYCESCERFLADRYVRGICPHCAYSDARGDQCESCGKLLDPTELKEPKCSSCSTTPKPRQTRHLYIDLPAIRPRLEAWMKEASVKGFWANNAIQMTQAWIRDGLKPRAITRDLKWGIPVPKPGFEGKVFYVWFDAPIGYISITATLGDEQGFDYRDWWMKPDEVELYQFIGKDNIPFHTVIFPSTLLGSGRAWTMLHHMSSTEYLNYESGKFSKSKGVGVFGTDVMETGIPADVWRFYIFYNRPEKSDVTFTWADFMEKVNGELIGNLGNLANRTLAFIQRFYAGTIPEGLPDAHFWNEVQRLEAEITDHLERAELRDAFRKAFQIADLANKRFQATEPWKVRNTDPAAANSLLSDLCYVLRDLAIIMHPFMPQAMSRLAGFMGKTVGQGGLSWKDVGTREGLEKLSEVGVLFSKLDPDHVAELRERFSGSQKERAAREAAKDSAAKSAGGISELASMSASTAKDLTPDLMVKQTPPQQPVTVSEPALAVPAKPPVPVSLPYGELAVEERFARLLDLRVARIIKVERHPKADKLYVETLDDGSGQERVIVSGLVPFYREDELLGKHIVLAANLKPAKLRGIESNGMLLAAAVDGPDGREVCEVIDVAWAVPGTRLVLSGQNPDTPTEARIDVDSFFSVPIRVAGGTIMVGTLPLEVNGRACCTVRVVDGTVG
jgi:methionyl-tRNA synthetase